MRKGEKQNQNNPVIKKKKKKSKFDLSKIPKQTILKDPSILPHCTQQSCGRILSQTWFEIQLCSVITRELQWFVWLMALPEDSQADGHVLTGYRVSGVPCAVLMPSFFSVITLVTWQKFGQEERAHLSHFCLKNTMANLNYRPTELKSFLSLTTLILSLQDAKGEKGVEGAMTVITIDCLKDMFGRTPNDDWFLYHPRWC